MNRINPLLGIIAIIIGLATFAQAQAPFANSLVAYYQFNGSAHDASGNARHGLVVGNATPAVDRFGRSASAYHFDGVSASIDITNAVFNVGQTEYTISGWFCSDDVSKLQQCVFNTIPHTGIALELNNENVPNYLMYGIGPADAFWTVIYAHGAKANYASQKWYHLVFTKSGTIYTVFINGLVDGQQTVTGSAAYNYNVGCRIGAIDNDGNEVFKGRLDDFRIYNRALSQEEVIQLHDYELNERPKFELVPGPFVSWTGAKADAEARSGHLATITSLAEWQQMTDLLGSTTSGKAWWLGGSDIAQEGMWKWVTGETWSYTRWAGGEPSGSGIYGQENCLLLSSDGTWNDAVDVSPAQFRVGYILESEPQLNVVKAIRPSFNSLALGANYQLQVSTDMITWTNQGSAFTATNRSMIYPQYWDVDNWSQLFFRLRVAP